MSSSPFGSFTSLLFEMPPTNRLRSTSAHFPFHVGPFPSPPFPSTPSYVHSTLFRFSIYCSLDPDHSLVTTQQTGGIPARHAAIHSERNQ